MKLFLAKFIMLLVAVVALAPFVIAQNAQNGQNSGSNAASASAAPAANGNAAPMGEDEKISFMEQEETRGAESVSTGGIIFKTLGAMLIIVGLIFFGAWGLKKFGFGNKTGAQADAPELSIVSSVTVGSGRTISSVKFGSRILLVGSTPQSFTLLADSADEDPFPVDNPRSVAELLAAEESFEDELAKADAGLISLFQGGRS